MVRRHAAEALGKMATRSAEALIQSLQDEDWLVRRNAAESLARLGAKQAIEPLPPVGRRKYDGAGNRRRCPCEFGMETGDLVITR